MRRERERVGESKRRESGESGNGGTLKGGMRQHASCEEEDEGRSESHKVQPFPCGSIHLFLNLRPRKVESGSDGLCDGYALRAASVDDSRTECNAPLSAARMPSLGQIVLLLLAAIV